MNGAETNKTDASTETRTTEEKQNLLGKHLSNVQDLVEDLREGEVSLEWEQYDLQV